MITRFKCVVCGKLTAGRIPRLHSRHKGDLTARFPRRHNNPKTGRPCDGNWQEAEWVDIDEKGNEVRNGGT